MVELQYLKDLLFGKPPFRAFRIRFTDGRVVRVRRRLQGVATPEYIMVGDDDTGGGVRAPLDKIASIEFESDAEATR